MGRVTYRIIARRRLTGLELTLRIIRYARRLRRPVKTGSVITLRA